MTIGVRWWGAARSLKRWRGLDDQPLRAEINQQPKTDLVMKIRVTRFHRLLCLSTAPLLALGVLGQTSEPAVAPSTVITISNNAPAKLPYGVEDVLKLTHAQVSEDVTLNYIQSSGTIYHLAPTDIVTLRGEGVSDKVINAMLDQRKSVPVEVANQNALQAQVTVAANASAPPPTDATTGALAPIYVQPAPMYVQPVPVVAQPEPEDVAPSTVYVIPYGPSGCTYYHYPSVYWGSSPAYGYASSVITIGAGYGGPRYYANSHHGGRHGGGVYRFGHR
jgi:hypothetical protein